MGSSVCPPAVESLMGPRVSASAAGRPQLRGRVPFSVHVWCCRGLAGLCRASQVVPGRPSARRRMCTQCPATCRARPGLSACPGTSFEAQFKCHIYTDSFPGLSGWDRPSGPLVTTPTSGALTALQMGCCADCSKTQLACSAVSSPRRRVLGRHLLKDELGRTTETVCI